MCGWFARVPLPTDLKEWRFMELKKEMYRLKTYPYEVSEGRKAAVLAEYNRRKQTCR